MASGWFYASLLLITQLIILISCEEYTKKVPFTYVADAIPKRAVCSDGSPAAYHHAIGFGEGVDNWIVYLKGGGSCNDNSTCEERRSGPYGTTRNLQPITFNGILSSDKNINPDFYNWNAVYVYYCDGSFFLGDTERLDLEPSLQFRGSRIFDAVMDELLSKGMKTAKNIMLVGRSAGGLATIIHCDSFGARLPNSSKFKCLSDGGFLISAKKVAAADYRERSFASVVTFHNLTDFLPKVCTSKMNPSLCLFPENFVQYVRTPLFILNSAFDYIEINMFLKPDNGDDLKGWQNCTNNLGECTNPQRQLIKDFRNAFMETLKGIGDNPSRGLFINACYNHAFSEYNDLWNSRLANVANTTISQAVGDWFFERRSVKLVDTRNDFPYECLI